ncbi:oligosaccharide flippase family protein [Roseomonas marmotae]|uniref:Oligosaccharide flippase family protein n=1 Tax=Roseomonas marmotae TaxID=2768161 RepID=A0ABS3KH09_9PROT|nr:oligosaccharide flippase family protein [Roseomonas marmotae]MBO1076769.1 oligosaccharide flippase family protein [Roseomonas marmotae]QTI78703.1 oligosaccharide flippase family protein [Roseomonas marmotae]
MSISDGAAPQNATPGSLLGRTMRGAGWVVAWRMVTRILGLASTLVLVRLLAPEDFGLVALATTFAIALDICLSIGVEDQLVRTPNPRPELYNTAFTLNLIRSLLVALVVAVAAEPASRFFSDARLEPVLLAIAFSAGAAGLTNVGAVEFRRHLAFEKEFQLQLMPRLLGIAVTIGSALVLHSHWALVLGIVVNRAGLVVMSYVLHPFRPRLALSAWRELAGVSAWSWAISVTTVFRDRMDNLVIGRTLAPVDVGIFAVGMEVAILPTTEVVDPICRACMPSFAASLRNGDMEEVADAYLRIVAVIALLTLPAGMGISLVSGAVVALAFGQEWLQAVPVVAILGLAWTITLFGNVSGALLTARAMLRTLLGTTATSALIRIPLMLAVIPYYGLTGAAAATAVVMLAEHTLLVGLALRLLRLRATRLLARVVRPVLATAVMALVLWSVGLGWAPPPGDAGAAVMQLLAGVGLGVVSFLAALGALWTLAGCPEGAESDMLRLIRRALSGLAVSRRLSVLRGG